MDELGQRLINDRAAILERRQRASELEKEAGRLRREADEIERISELSRLQRS